MDGNLLFTSKKRAPTGASDVATEPPSPSVDEVTPSNIVRRESIIQDCVDKSFVTAGATPKAAPMKVEESGAVENRNAKANAKGQEAGMTNVLFTRKPVPPGPTAGPSDVTRVAQAAKTNSGKQPVGSDEKLEPLDVLPMPTTAFARVPTDAGSSMSSSFVSQQQTNRDGGRLLDKAHGPPKKAMAETPVAESTSRTISGTSKFGTNPAADLKAPSQPAGILHQTCWANSPEEGHPKEGYEPSLLDAQCTLVANSTMKGQIPAKPHLARNGSPIEVVSWDGHSLELPMTDGTSPIEITNRSSDSSFVVSGGTPEVSHTDMLPFPQRLFHTTRRLWLPLVLVAVLAFVLGLVTAGVGVFLATKRSTGGLSAIDQPMTGRGVGSDGTTTETGPPVNPDQDAVDYIYEIRDSLIGDDILWLDPGDPQMLATEWLAVVDSPRRDAGSSRLRQRYVLMVLYYGNTSSEQVWSQLGWANTGLDECEWEGIDCNEDGIVVQVDIPRVSFGMSGSLPTEIATMDSLGE